MHDLCIEKYLDIEEDLTHGFIYIWKYVWKKISSKA